MSLLATVVFVLEIPRVTSHHEVLPQLSCNRTDPQRPHTRPYQVDPRQNERQAHNCISSHHPPHGRPFPRRLHETGHGFVVRFWAADDGVGGEPLDGSDAAVLDDLDAEEETRDGYLGGERWSAVGGAGGGVGMRVEEGDQFNDVQHMPWNAKWARRDILMAERGFSQAQS
ncbi:hypothetical protein MBM_08912 [Drepanopeziza brunnea f. sp. 'multigermtubi' MB_m1]|uniref:Uncharacterized protein n=1 Tax=Marssonina brunnea f. sp. multigermtubi (strain MB_m1) TaxID=1072389 RepID=K1WW95_MARBU|nr:uncharacterized protein MBM_08912 [Drepanopeziza brunnea f. sp. 'multigermtubi' MB_m1]EKD12958.1 hypothetical protein MBM_08912 [Drepanopeziza brunnea f. sp. 'multigermtubi' MB_m1]